jgi:hypothetical protein
MICFKNVMFFNSNIYKLCYFIFFIILFYEYLNKKHANKQK